MIDYLDINGSTSVVVSNCCGRYITIVEYCLSVDNIHTTIATDSRDNTVRQNNKSYYFS